MANIAKDKSNSDPQPLHPYAESAVDRFATKVKESFGNNLLNLTVYGPAVTAIFHPRLHHIHHLIVLAQRDVDQLLALARHSKQATAQRIAPPLILTDRAISQSYDVFPLEWLDITQFHRTVIGDAILKEIKLKQTLVRLQCERELRSLDILLQRGVLASGGKPRRINRLESGAADSLIRVLRGIGWLAGDRQPLLPDDVCNRCEAIIEFSLPGCMEAIRIEGRHDIQTLRLMLDELGQLSTWIDKFRAVDL